MAVSHTGIVAAAEASSPDVSVFDENGTHVQTLAKGQCGIKKVLFDSASNYLLSLALDGTVKLWSFQSHSPVVLTYVSLAVEPSAQREVMFGCWRSPLNPSPSGSSSPQEP
eukprot:CAMPEP_0175118286 /NCGR_PEP_ID=MMETSP0086_2-20121207/19447_1 /TAXON_ID=136419 /ORGANISM="Unknown Unknown, Strain D1" /LENGTH=110 /DNA_ID=CAMNT_0016399269 /DNA_START=310 /DNA_END=639 /DNA_ORIENTATION=+